MEKYQKYVWDFKKRKLLGKFEEMYKNELKEGYDSWYQEDNRGLGRKIDLAILDNYNFEYIVDLGCGKGTLCHLLKKKNNRILGIDISEVALKYARARYPDIDFICLDLDNITNVAKLLNKLNKHKPDLIMIVNTLFFIKKWKILIKLISMHTNYIMTSLYIPEDTIGYIKNINELLGEISKHFNVIECVKQEKAMITHVFGKSKHANKNRV